MNIINAGMLFKHHCHIQQGVIVNTLKIVVVTVIWVAGGLVTLYLANKKEGSYRNKSALQSFCDDVADQPLPAMLGYFFLFVFWWAAALRALISHLFEWGRTLCIKIVLFLSNEKHDNNRSPT